MQAQSAPRSPSAKAGVEGRKALEGIDGFAGGTAWTEHRQQPGAEGCNSCDVKENRGEPLSRGFQEKIGHPAWHSGGLGALRF